MTGNWTYALVVGAAALMLASSVPVSGHHSGRVDNRIVQPYNVPVLIHVPVLAGYEPMPPPQPCLVGDRPVGPFYAEHFEGAHGWTFVGTSLSSGAGGNLWRTTSFPGAGSDGGHSAPNRLYFGNPASGNFNAGHVAGVAQSPALTVPAGNVVLSFADKWNVEWLKGYDHLWVEARLANGQVHLLCHANSLDRGDATSTGDLHHIGSCSPVLAAPCPSNLWTAWEVRQVAVPASFAGQAVQFRFTFDSADDVANTFMGWMIDDVELAVVS